MTERMELADVLRTFFNLSADDQAFVRAQLNEASNRVLDEFARKGRGFSPQLESLIECAGDGPSVGKIKARSLSALRDVATRTIPPDRPAARTAGFGMGTLVSAIRGIR